MKSPLPPTKQELRQMLVRGENLGFNRNLEEIIGDLRCPLPSDYLDCRNSYNSYPSKDSLYWVFNYICPGWSWKIEFTQLGDCLIAECQIKIQHKKGSIVMKGDSAAYWPDDNDPLKEAEEKAFFNAASKFLGFTFHSI